MMRGGKVNTPKLARDIRLSPQDIEFLTKKCHINPMMSMSSLSFLNG
jgi:hypothetical protein